ncbi:Universal stress protein [Musa troglodytarum]|uniref:Universal stress protein n=1 Tax=Musa troglodytarum TaxID=320322 RepID=A0A9E7GKB0_9LILI|nr:Universal stress protein [Musa troglodytarum]
MCLEIERLGLSAVIMGSRGFRASTRSSESRLGSVSDCCVHHCLCLVVAVRYPDDGAGSDAPGAGGLLAPRVNGSALPVICENQISYYNIQVYRVEVTALGCCQLNKPIHELVADSATASRSEILLRRILLMLHVPCL